MQALHGVVESLGLNYRVLSWISLHHMSHARYVKSESALLRVPSAPLAFWFLQSIQQDEAESNTQKFCPEASETIPAQQVKAARGTVRTKAGKLCELKSEFSV